MQALIMRGNMVAYSVAKGSGGGEGFLDTVAALWLVCVISVVDCGLPAYAAISLEIVLDKDRHQVLIREED